MSYGHLHRLDLLVFRRDGADFIAHLIALHWHILTFNAGGERKKEIQNLENSGSKVGVWSVTLMYWSHLSSLSFLVLD